MSEIELLIFPIHLLFPVSINTHSILPVVHTKFLDVTYLCFIPIPKLSGNPVVLFSKYKQNLVNSFLKHSNEYSSLHGGDRIPVELFQILEDDAVKVLHSVQFRSVAQSFLTLCGPMNCSMPGLPIHHQLPVHSNSLPSSW